MDEILEKLKVGINMKMAIRRYCELSRVAGDILEETIEKLKGMKLYEIQKLNSELKNKSREEIRPLTDGIKR